MATEGGAMTEPGYEVTHVDQIPELVYDDQPDGTEWRPLRIHFGITSFGTNAFGARERGQTVVVEHSETEESGTRHEELYFVAKGHATFRVEGEEIDAPEGTLVYVPDPDAMRSAVALEAGTTILCFGGTPGEAFSVSPWEQKYDPATAR
jgi:mannose-6-phosphate isomerase-like protein (cupin superfamily)